MRIEWNPDKIEEAQKAANKKLIAIGFLISRSAKEFASASVDTGRLRASISVNWTGSGLSRGETETFRPRGVGRYQEQLEGAGAAADGVGEPKGDRFTVVVGTNVRYAPFVEFGTWKMSPKSYLRPAYERHKKLVAASTGVIREREVPESGVKREVPER